MATKNSTMAVVTTATVATAQAADDFAVARGWSNASILRHATTPLAVVVRLRMARALAQQVPTVADASIELERVQLQLLNALVPDMPKAKVVGAKALVTTPTATTRFGAMLRDKTYVVVEVGAARAKLNGTKGVTYPVTYEIGGITESTTMSERAYARFLGFECVSVPFDGSLLSITRS